MSSARPLRDVFADLTGGGNATDDPQALLGDHGHPALPEHLVAEAVVSYADTAPAEVAEHLAPYVTTHSAVGADPMPGDESPADWLDLLSTAPAGPDLADEPADIDDLTPPPDGLDDATGPDDPGPALDFGTGAGVETDGGSDDAGPDGSGDDAETEHPADELDEMPADPAALDDDGGVDVGWMAGDLTADPSGGDETESDEDDTEPGGDAFG
jgi:hypothetical protein